MVAATRFEWDENKNRANVRKHGVSFEDASQVFSDPLHLTVHDRIEGGEQRWQTFGLAGGFVLMMVAHTTTEEDAEGKIVEIIRIISARRATRKERQHYENEDG
ncbi:BrnT family toxin [Acidiphilium sp.]|uniref:BrnT family toxin n=1 Tax=Acidiphilium sp. TaxID=527 RepID=UPI002B693060|nr:BrnT family toxin [Acidiphilium sp.]HQT62746.1 BrnT family toxin [Acidiphilium sp.]HQT74971.1 BrnT family toxin [Acidiphilium sp.]